MPKFDLTIDYNIPRFQMIGNSLLVNEENKQFLILCMLVAGLNMKRSRLNEDSFKVWRMLVHKTKGYATKEYTETFLEFLNSTNFELMRYLSDIIRLQFRIVETVNIRNVSFIFFI